jgi:3-oxoacyl-[acyl-carrier protein] reductase
VHSATGLRRESSLLEGRAALVTGASRGIGAKVAEKLAANGAAVALNFRQQRDRARAVAERIAQIGGRAVLAQADLTQDRPTRKMVEHVREQLGFVEILVHAAYPGWRGGPAVKTPWADFQHYFESMVGSLHRLLGSLVPDMVARRRGSIVLLTSTSLYTLNSEHAAYATAKSALVGLGRSLATDLGPYGVRVNLVAPSLLWTGDGPEPPGWGTEHCERSAMKRLPTAEEVAGVVAFFASPWSSAVTGAHLSPGAGLLYVLG